MITIPFCISHLLPHHFVYSFMLIFLFHHNPIILTLSYGFIIYSHSSTIHSFISIYPLFGTVYFLLFIILPLHSLN